MALSDIGREKDTGSKFSTKSVAGVLEKYGQMLIDGTTKNLEGSDAIATRKLIQSIRFNIKILGIDYEATLKMEDYWKYVEDGRKPGKRPPVSAIMKWLVDKGRKATDVRSSIKASRKKFKNIKNNTLRKGLVEMSEERKLRNKAFMIAKRIGERGTKATHFFSNTLTDDFRDGLNKELSKALKKDVIIAIDRIKLETDQFDKR